MNEQTCSDLAPPADTTAPETKSASLATTATATAAKPTTTPTSTTSTTASTTSTTAASATPSSTTTTSTPVQFQGALAGKDAETLKAEYEKRKNRAARFGIPLKEQDKAIERAARFGVPVTAKATASLAKATASTLPSASTALPNKPGSIKAQVRDLGRLFTLSGSLQNTPYNASVDSHDPFFF